MNTCKTCKHSQCLPLLGWGYMVCNHPDNLKEEPATGDLQHDGWKFCVHQRSDIKDRGFHCGSSGGYHERTSTPIWLKRLGF